MKATKRPLRTVVFSVLRALTYLIPRQPRMIILFYHSIRDHDDFFAVSPVEFDRQMRYLKDSFDVVPLERALRHATGEKVERDSVSVTVDDGYRDFAENAAPILKKCAIPATVFALGENPIRAELGNDYPLLTAQDAAALKDAGLTVGSHALSHKKLTKLPREEALQELVESKKGVVERFGGEAEYLAYPKGAHNPQVMELAREAGYKGAVTVAERRVRVGDDAYALPRIQVDSTVSFNLFRAKTSPAQDLYYALWRVLH
jgi:peptidoglycan/xylan/chitin deacetylase (PgdA/CDA1 family)